MLVREVFANLISNALKYNLQPQKWVEIGCLLPDPAAGERGPVLYVRDNGIGIREKHHDSVFNVLRRLHGRDEFGGGSGAGLAIAKSIVERHGGRIWLESVYGGGTTFFFTLK